MTVRKTRSAETRGDGGPDHGTSAVDDALSALSAAQTLQRAAEELTKQNPSLLSAADRESFAVRALLDGLQASYACIGRWSASDDAVLITGQRSDAALQESTEFELPYAPWIDAVRAGESVLLDALKGDTPILDCVGAARALLTPLQTSNSSAAGFLLIGDSPALDILSPAMRTFIDAIARWVVADGVVNVVTAPAEPISAADTGAGFEEPRRRDPDDDLLVEFGNFDAGDEADTAPLLHGDTGAAGVTPDDDLLANIIEHMDQGLIVVDEDLSILAVNGRVKDLLSLPPGVLVVGGTMVEFFRFCAERGDYGPGDPEELTQTRVVTAKNKTSAHGLERRFGDGRVVACSHRSTGKGHIVVTYTDVTHVRENERELARKSELLEATVQHMDQGLFAFDGDLTVLYANDRARALLSVPENLLAPGSSCVDITAHCADRGDFGPGSAAGHVTDVLERCRGDQWFTLERTCPGGVVVMERCHPRPEGGFVVTLTDITATKEQEEALLSVTEALRKTSTSLKHRTAHLERMFDNMGRGVALFDADQLLVTCNTLFVDTLPFPDTLCQPGTSVEDIHAHCLKLVIEDDVDRVTAPHPSGDDERGRQEFRLHLTDGRVLEVVQEPLEDGGSLAIYQDITDRDRAEQKLRDYAARLEQQKGVLDAILDNLTQGVSLVDGELVMQAMNQRGMELLEFPDELLGQGTSLEAFFRFNAERGEYGPGDVNELVAARMDLARRFEAHKFERVRPDGTVIEVIGTPLPDGRGMVTTYTDVTELRQHERDLEALAEKLRAANMQLDAAFNSMHQGLAMFDSEQRLLVRNNRYIELFGFSEDFCVPGVTIEELTRHSIAEGNEGDPDSILQRRMEIARSRERIVFDRRMSDGRMLEISHEPLDDGGSLAVYLDVTARMEAEARLREYTAKLEASNRELQEFAHVASHDLQEPLRKIEAFGDRLFRKCGERLGEDGLLYVDRMQESSRRLRNLINDLLSYSRVTTKAQPFVDVDMNVLVEEVIFDLETSIEEAGGTVEVGPLPTLQADDTQMRQLVINLISNALKFRKADTPPTLHLTSREIDDPSGEEGYGRWCEMSFADNGIGFSNKYADRIFTIFQRLHARSTYEGTGIGLSTCRKIAERHGGDITADGTPDEGAVFRVRLPLRQSEDHGAIEMYDIAGRDTY